MTRHDDQVRLRHMFEHACEAIQLANNKSRTDWDSDRVLELALTRLIEIVGEAAARVSLGTREKHPQIPWLEIVGYSGNIGRAGLLDVIAAFFGVFDHRVEPG